MAMSPGICGCRCRKLYNVSGGRPLPPSGSFHSDAIRPALRPGERHEGGVDVGNVRSAVDRESAGSNKTWLKYITNTAD
jgi:hypothetical protein